MPFNRQKTRFLDVQQFVISPLFPLQFVYYYKIAIMQEKGLVSCYHCMSKLGSLDVRPIVCRSNSNGSLSLEAINVLGLSEEKHSKLASCQAAPLGSSLTQTAAYKHSSMRVLRMYVGMLWS